MSYMDQYKKSQTGFDALPAAVYDGTIAGNEVLDFSKSPGYYSGKKALNVKLRVIDAAPLGAKRVFFSRIGLFPNFAPSQKYPEGSLNFSYFQFLEAIGVPDEEVTDERVNAGWFPEPRYFLGRPIAFKLDYFPETHPDAALHHISKITGQPEAWNDVSRIYKARENAPVAAPTNAAPALAANVWAAAATSAPATAQVALPATANAWGVSPQEAAQVAAPAPQSEPSVWGGAAQPATSWPTAESPLAAAAAASPGL